MSNFYEYLENNHPKFHQELLNEIDMKYWMDKAAQMVGGVEKVGKAALQKMALKLALGAAGASALTGGGQAQERPYEQVPVKPAITMQKPDEEINPLAGRAKAMLGDNKIDVNFKDIKKNPKGKVKEITFEIQIPTYREVSKYSKQDYDPTITIKNEIKKIFLKKELKDLNLNPYSIKSAAINDEMISGRPFDVIKKVLNTADPSMNTIYKQYIDYKMHPKMSNDKQLMTITLYF